MKLPGNQGIRLFTNCQKTFQYPCSRDLMLLLTERQLTERFLLRKKKPDLFVLQRLYMLSRGKNGFQCGDHRAAITPFHPGGKTHRFIFIVCFCRRQNGCDFLDPALVHVRASREAHNIALARRIAPAERHLNKTSEPQLILQPGRDTIGKRMVQSALGYINDNFSVPVHLLSEYPE